MKCFIEKIIRFAILCLLVIYSLIFYFEYRSYTCSHIDPYRQINEVYNSKNINADVLISGNSRADNSYNDSLLSQLLGVKCLKIAWSGYPFDYQYHVMIKTYLSQNSRPSYIIQEIGPWAFLDYYNPKYTIEMMPYLNRKEFNFLKTLCPEISSNDKYRIVRYSGKLDNVIFQLACMEWKKWKPKFVSPNKSFNKNCFTTQQPLECDSSIINTLIHFIKECSNENIELIFVFSPMNIEYGQKYFDLNGFWAIFNDISKTYKIKTLNYQNLFGSDTIYFTDPVHLNEAGRDCFTRQLAHDLDSLNIICRQN